MCVCVYMYDLPNIFLTDMKYLSKIKYLILYLFQCIYDIYNMALQEIYCFHSSKLVILSHRLTKGLFS